jgi:hypothetical protein
VQQLRGVHLDDALVLGVRLHVATQHHRGRRRRHSFERFAKLLGEQNLPAKKKQKNKKGKKKENQNQNQTQTTKNKQHSRLLKRVLRSPANYGVIILYCYCYSFLFSFYFLFLALFFWGKATCNDWGHEPSVSSRKASSPPSPVRPARTWRDQQS